MFRVPRSAFHVLTAVGLSACSPAPSSPPPPLTLTLDTVAVGLSEPLFVTAPPGDTLRVFVVEKTGTVRIIAHDTLLTIPYLDLSRRVSRGSEQGLLSIAFHPDYASNGFVYASYTDAAGDTRIVRYTVSADANVADSTTGDTILAVPQPYSNHNGGLIAFGPDGMLWVGLGDGGSGGDPQNRAQHRDSLLGKLLRLDVDGASPYAIPADNPFVSDTTARPEIWSYGLRNPWRFSFDRATGDLYIADVGQGQWEEVDVAPSLAGRGSGVNWGWRVMEGAHCYNAATCNTSGLALPLVEYSHADGCSITGGYVYRGQDIPALQGTYFYADYCSGWIRSFRLVGGQATAITDWTGTLDPNGFVSSFGEDGRGELYVTTLNGMVWRLREP